MRLRPGENADSNDPNSGSLSDVYVIRISDHALAKLVTATHSEQPENELSGINSLKFSPDSSTLYSTRQYGQHPRRSMPFRFKAVASGLLQTAMASRLSSAVNTRATVLRRIDTTRPMRSAVKIRISFVVKRVTFSDEAPSLHYAICRRVNRER
jgi:hypothetical protein